MLISVTAAMLATSWSPNVTARLGGPRNHLRDVKMTSMLPRLARRRRRHDNPIHREGYETSEECWDAAPGS